MEKTSFNLIWQGASKMHLLWEGIPERGYHPLTFPVVTHYTAV